MARKLIFCVQPFRRERNRLVANDLKQFKTAADALRVGDGMMGRTGVVGALVYEIEGDLEFDDWGEPRTLASHGEVPEASF